MRHRVFRFSVAFALTSQAPVALGGVGQIQGQITQSFGGRVAVASPADAQVLVFSSATGTWGSGALSGSSITGPIRISDGTAAEPAYSFSSSGNTDNGMFLLSSDTLGFSAAGTTRAILSSSGLLALGSSLGASVPALKPNGANLRVLSGDGTTLRSPEAVSFDAYDSISSGKAKASLQGPTTYFSSDTAIAWVSTDNINAGSADLILQRDAANVLAQRNGVEAQTLRLYNSFTDASNNVRLEIRAGATSTVITQVKSGSGGELPLDIYTTDAAELRLGTGAAVTWEIAKNSDGQHLRPRASNTRDLGTSSLRVRTGYLGTQLDVSATADQLKLSTGTLTWTPTTTRTLTLPDLTATVATVNGGQTFTAGTWNGTAITHAYGGTGLTATPTNGQIPIGNGSGYALAGISGTANQVSVANGAGTITLSTPQSIHTGATPTFSTLSLSAASNQLVLQSGGVTGTLTWTPASSNKTITLPNTTGTVALTSDLSSAGGWTDSGTSVTLTTSTDTLTVPGTGTSSERFGSGATATGTGGCSFGNAAASTNGVAAGQNASTTTGVSVGNGTDGGAGISIGNGVKSTSSDAANVIVGSGDLSGNTANTPNVVVTNTLNALGTSGAGFSNNVVVGARGQSSPISVQRNVFVGESGDFRASNADCTAVGQSFSVTSSVARATGLGASLTLDASDSITLGYQANAAANTFTAGSAGGSAMTSVYFGEGNAADGTPVVYTIKNTPALGSNIAGAAIRFEGGLATGNAASGALEWWTGDAGGSGSTLQTATVKLSLSQSTLTFSDGVNVALNTTTGTKWGTATGQKQGWFNASPAAQQAAIAALTNGMSDTTVNGDLEDVGSVTADPAPIERNFSELNAKINSLRSVFSTFGFTAP